MADIEQVAVLTNKGVTEWNNWRKEHPLVVADLFEAHLAGANL